MNQLTNFLTQPILLGLIWGILSIGVFIAYRILDIADLSVEGVLPLSAIVSLYLINLGVNPWISLIVSIIVGVLSGILTASIHIYLKIPAILSGIIVMTGLFSIVVVLSLGNISTANDTIFTPLNTFLANYMNTGWASWIGYTAVLILIVLIVLGLTYWFFGTELGVAIRATGKNKVMANAQGINTSKMVIIGLAISSALVGLAGGLLGQYQTYCASTTGKGSIVIGLATLFLGEVIFGKRSFKNHLISIMLGGFVYWYIINAVLLIPGFNANYLYLIQAIIITIVMVLPVLTNYTLHQSMNRIKRGGKNAKN